MKPSQPPRTQVATTTCLTPVSVSSSQCSNERPYCHKCIASGKECEGYERERVFITGTPQNKGRVASHPKKGSSSTKQRSPSAKKTPRALEITPTQPLKSAWENHTSMSSEGAEYSVLVSALNARLPYPSPNNSARDESSSPFHITFPPYTPTEIQPFMGEGDLNVRAQCLVRIPNSHDQDDPAQSYCVFFFEHETAYAFGESGSNQVRRLGPAYFGHFPNHHFFVRVYRPLALLRSCLSLERHFSAWFQFANRPSYGYPMAYWADEIINPGALLPFSNLYTFRDGNTGLALLYYWMTQIHFHQCIENLHRIIHQPAIDAYPDMWPNLPYDLQIDITQYQHGRLFAADICRGLDSVLHETVQPDMLILPMKVAMDFYKDIHATSQDGLMEIMWIDNFRLRLVEKGQHVAGVLQSQKWSEVATF
ncbi:hypothetical protein FSST1_001775 [Fusarium sambucinum]